MAFPGITKLIFVNKKWKAVQRRLLLLLAPLLALTVMLGLHSRQAAANPAAPETWQPWQEVATETTILESFTASPVLDMAPDGELVIAYSTADGNIMFSRSQDGGMQWSGPALIHGASGSLSQVMVAFDNDNNGHAIWRHVFEESVPGVGEVTRYEIQHKSEAQWGSGHAATGLPGNGLEILSPAAMAFGPDDTIHVVFAQGENQPTIYHTYSRNGGSSWSSPTALSEPGLDALAPAVTVDSAGNVHVAWENGRLTPGGIEFEIAYKKGTPLNGGGYSWDTAATSLSKSIKKVRVPSLQATGTTLHVAFTQLLAEDEQYAYYTRYTPGGGWTLPLDVTRGNAMSVHQNSPFFLITSLATCNNKSYIYFHGAEARNAAERIWGTNSGIGWADPLPITTDNRRYIQPDVVCDGGSLHLVGEWLDGNIHRILYRRNDSTIFLSLIRRR